MPLRPLKELVPRRSSRLRSAGALVFHFFSGLPSYVALLTGHWLKTGVVRKKTLRLRERVLLTPQFSRVRIHDEGLCSAKMKPRSV